MTRKKSKFITFLCSLIPGAGEMYLGFFKQGISIMGLFFAVCVLGGIIFPPLITFSIIIWFYSFFHSHNLNGLPDEEFYAIHDDFLIHSYQLEQIKIILLTRYRKLFAVSLILIALSMISSLLNDFYYQILLEWIPLSQVYQDIFHYFTHRIPQAFMAVVILLAGLYLIKNKKNELLLTDEHMH